MLQCWQRTGICPLFSSPLRGFWQLKNPHPLEFAIQGKKKMLMPRGQTGGELGAVGIDWRISTAKVRRLNQFGTAVLVWCGKSVKFDRVCRTFVELNLGLTCGTPSESDVAPVLLQSRTYSVRFGTWQVRLLNQALRIDPAGWKTKTMPSKIGFPTLTGGVFLNQKFNVNKPAAMYDRRLLIAAVFHFVHPVQKDSQKHHELTQNSVSFSCQRKQVPRCCIIFRMNSPVKFWPIRA